MLAIKRVVGGRLVTRSIDESSLLRGGRRADGEEGIMTRICTKCGKIRPVTQFQLNRSSAGPASRFALFPAAPILARSTRDALVLIDEGRR